MFNAEQWEQVRALVRAKASEEEFKPGDIAAIVTDRVDGERVRRLCREIVSYTATYPIDGRELSETSRGGFWWFGVDAEDINEAERIARMPGRMPRNPFA